ncbi:MAG: PIN domain nuclease [Actinomycetota bacterium]|nr:PIN domain nuclease [Actinomycetota bacterium]
MTLVLDSAALISLDRNERGMWVRLKSCERSATPPLTHGGVVGQVWRGGPRQARLSRALHGIDVRPLDEDLGRAAGVLLARTRHADVIDAALALLANDGDDIVTSDIEDLEPMAAATGRHVELIRP